MVSPYAEFTVYHPRPGLRTAAEIRRQKTRRQEGAASDAIFLLLLGEGALTESTPQEGASSRAPRCPRARGSRRRKGQSLRPDTQSLWAVALHLGLSVARNFPPPGTPTPPSQSALALGLSGRSFPHRRPLFPRDTGVIGKGVPGSFRRVSSFSFLLVRRD